MLTYRKTRRRETHALRRSAAVPAVRAWEPRDVRGRYPAERLPKYPWRALLFGAVGEGERALKSPRATRNIPRQHARELDCSDSDCPIRTYVCTYERFANARGNVGCVGSAFA